MSKERELLNRCAVTLKARDICPLLLTEISELLAQPEQIEQEPVAWMSKEKGDVNKSRSYFKFPEEHQHETIVPLYEREGLTPREALTEYKKGYARAEVDLKREPLNEDVIWDNMPENPMECSALAFIRGVKFAEKAHGIGEQK